MHREFATPAPAVSILTPAYDVARYVGAAVDSVLAQGFRDWEMIVVDDGSRDGTAEVVASRKDPRIRLIAQDIVGHFEGRLEAMAGKAMVVCMSRRICVALYDEIAKLRPSCCAAATATSRPSRRATRTRRTGRRRATTRAVTSWRRSGRRAA